MKVLLVCPGEFLPRTLPTGFVFTGVGQSRGRDMSISWTSLASLHYPTASSSLVVAGQSRGCDISISWISLTSGRRQGLGGDGETRALVL